MTRNNRHLRIILPEVTLCLCMKSYNTIWLRFSLYIYCKSISRIRIGTASNLGIISFFIQVCNIGTNVCEQGFVSIGEVDTKGRARRLPIKADIRRALCFPGGSTLMVSHLNMGTSANTNEPLKFCPSLKPTEHSFPSATVHNPTLGSKEVCLVPCEAVNQIMAITEYPDPQGLVKDDFQVDGRYNPIISVCHMFYYCSFVERVF